MTFSQLKRTPCNKGWLQQDRKLKERGSGRKMLVDAHCHYEKQDLNGLVPFEPVLSLSNRDKWDSVRVGGKEEEEPGIKRGMGIHPWYAHLYTFDSHIEKLDHYNKVLKWSGNAKEKLQNFDSEFATLVGQLPDPIVLPRKIDLSPSLPQFIGEVGLDKVFRIPLSKTKEGFGDTVGLSHFTCTLEHQLVILEWWLHQAARHSLSVQVHAVKYPDPVLQACKRCLLANPHCKILLHGYQGSRESLEQWIKIFTTERVYVSFNTHLNERLLESYRTVLDSHHALAETDWPEFHREQYEILQDITKKVQQCYDNSIDFKSNIQSFLH